MRKIEFAAELLAVQRLVVMGQEPRIDVVEWWRGVLAPTQDRAAANVVQDYIKIMGLIGIAAIVKEYVRAPSSSRLRGDSDGFSRWGARRCRERRGRPEVRWVNTATGDNAENRQCMGWQMQFNRLVLQFTGTKSMSGGNEYAEARYAGIETLSGCAHSR